MPFRAPARLASTVSPGAQSHERSHGADATTRVPRVETNPFGEITGHLRAKRDPPDRSPASERGGDCEVEFDPFLSSCANQLVEVGSSADRAGHRKRPDEPRLLPDAVQKDARVW